MQCVRGTRRCSDSKMVVSSIPDLRPFWEELACFQTVPAVFLPQSMLYCEVQHQKIKRNIFIKFWSVLRFIPSMRGIDWIKVKADFHMMYLWKGCWLKSKVKYRRNIRVEATAFIYVTSINPIKDIIEESAVIFLQGGEKQDINYSYEITILIPSLLTV